MFDGKAFGEDMVAIVRGYVARELDPLRAENKALSERIAVLEARSAEPGPAGKDGSDGKDGVSIDPTEVERMIAEAATKAVAALPPAEPGKDGEPGQDGADGKSVDEEIVAVMVREEVARAVAEIPPAENGADGKDVDPEVTAGLVRDEVKKAIEALPPPERGEKGEDGAGIADLVIDRAGNLVATFTDGRMKELGCVVGKDGDPGKEGRDGFSLEHFDTKWDGDRTLTLSFSDGKSEYSHEMRLPIMIYRDVYAEGKSYETGDVVTWGGSVWVAQRDTGSKPDSPESGWRLAVKRGRDGKDKA